MDQKIMAAAIADMARKYNIAQEVFNMLYRDENKNLENVSLYESNIKSAELLDAYINAEYVAGKTITQVMENINDSIEDAKIMLDWQ